MKLNELVLLKEIMERELSKAKERTTYFKEALSGMENQVLQYEEDEVDEEVIEVLSEEVKDIRTELKDAVAYENAVANIVHEISDREFSII